MVAPFPFPTLVMAARMNLTISTAGGLVSLSDREAILRRDQLRDQLARSDVPRQRAILVELDEIKRILDRSRHYEDIYTMPFAAPGWVPDP